MLLMGRDNRIGMCTVLWIMGTSGYVRKTFFLIFWYLTRFYCSMPMRAVSVLSAALLQECRYRLKVGADKTLCSLRLELRMLREYVDSSGHLKQLSLVSILARL